MFSIIIAKLTDPAFLMMLLIGVAAGAAVITAAMPFLEKEELNQRMKDVATERDKIRTRERERMNAGSGKGQQASLRHGSVSFIRSLVNDFKLESWLGTDNARVRLQMAGYRGQQAEYTFIFFRLVAPIVMLIGGAIYAFFIMDPENTFLGRMIVILMATYAGIKLPELFVGNQISKRQKSISKAFPDALDLTLICVESGMSTEQSFRKVAIEIGAQSIPLAEELTLANAELSYLPDRRQAYDNLSMRTGIDGVKSVCMALTQAEKYGTPIGTALRVLSQEFRDTRMNLAEKKAAALPPKLTVPMILFFLPVLFVVILGPAVITVMEYK
jgi:tight adherence protein C